jgi:hypothetical protein
MRLHALAEVAAMDCYRLGGPTKQEQLRAARAALRAHLTTRPVPAGWISVDERLPENDDKVLVYVPNNKHTKTMIDRWAMQREASIEFSSVTIETGFMWDEYEFEGVTHWQPLPAPPGAAPTKDE